jgi:hypothetical protein
MVTKRTQTLNNPQKPAFFWSPKRRPLDIQTSPGLWRAYANHADKKETYCVSFRAFYVALALLMGVSLGPTAQAQDYSGTEGPPIKFSASLSADEQSAPTESPGSGQAEFVLDRPTQRLDWTITYSGLTSNAVAAHAHGPQTPGGNAGVLFDLAPEGMKSPLKGSRKINDGELEYLLTGRIYVNIHTTKLPAGELRGQMMRQRPE